MNPLSRLIPVALAAALLPAGAWAAAHDHNHGAPATAANSPEMNTDSPPAAAAAAAAAAADPAAQLPERMRDLHARLQAAKGAGERRQLLAESRRLLQEAMAALDAEAMPRRKMGMGMMDHDHAAEAPAAATGGATANAPAGNDKGMSEMKGMKDMDMQQCQEMHEGKARHMALMHAVLQALVDQATALPSK